MRVHYTALNRARATARVTAFATTFTTTLAVLIAASLVPLHAQEQAPGTAAMFFVGQPVEVLEAQPFMAQETVAGAAFSADAVTDFTQVLYDGNRIERHYSTAIARDSRGRTRREQEVALLGPLASLQSDPPKFVTISDPVADTHYTLDANAKIAFRSPVSTAAVHIESGKMTQPHRLTVTSPLQTRMVTDVFIDKEAGAPDVTTELLGSRQIEGVTADGTRTTMTIPAGQIGNVAPIEVVTERWFSRDLQEPVLITRRDPRSGETVYRLTNIVRAEPPADLFTVPPDYDLRDPGNVNTRLRVVRELKGSGSAGIRVTPVPTPGR